MNEKDYPFAYVCSKCGGYAFYIKNRPCEGERIKLSDFLFNGKQPEGKDDMICQICNRKIYNLTSKNIVERAHK